MSEIKTPVRACVMDCEPAFADATGRRIETDEIVAALNAAPKRAFGELTVRALRDMMEDVIAETGDIGGSYLPVFLTRLQAFAAPVAPKVPTLAEAILDTAKLVGNSRFWHAIRDADERAGKAKLAASMVAYPRATSLQSMLAPGAAAWVETFAAELSTLTSPAAPEARPVVVMVKSQDGASCAAVSVPGWVAPKAQGGAEDA